MSWKEKLNKLKNDLNTFDAKSINLVRTNLFDKQQFTNKSPRCWNKLREIDKKYFICRDVKMFLDLCGGPGEFVNYVMSLNPFCSAFGVTLTFNIPCVYKRSVVKRKNFTTIVGPDNTGDIQDKNVAFEINLYCNHKCDLVLADGSLDVSGQENKQEILNFDLIMCEIRLILISLREGGNCVLKVFDAFERKTLIMLNNFVINFETWHLYKPPSSRPANSERYLICLNKLNVSRTDDDIDKLIHQFNKHYKNQYKNLNLLVKTLQACYNAK
ncbi:Mtase [Oxyplax ochracea nucleopolyhedrovirus]|uniref:Mtase n=1 Tax=Oxyplax ochracea nucleopolyhedrovirus TaxID=2083176 RepID=A0A2L0WU37_9ABAC|nr:Mtase [Oxyplax ochracea nucleopolyhedrovirus]AVA31167.1 Mtase [Oxyplax ochracea nucleopolyhedrovirus]